MDGKQYMETILEILKLSTLNIGMTHELFLRNLINPSSKTNDYHLRKLIVNN